MPPGQRSQTLSEYECLTPPLFQNRTPSSVGSQFPL